MNQPPSDPPDPAADAEPRSWLSPALRAQLPFYVGVLLLTLVGITLAWVRHIELGIPWFPGAERPVWLVEARVDFIATGSPVLASLDLPSQPPGFRIVSEQATSPGYGFAIVDEQGNRRGEWSKRSADGPQTLFYKVQFVPVRPGEDNDVPAGDQPTPRARPVFWEEPEATAAEQLIAAAYARSSTPESLTRELIKLLAPETADQNAALLLAESDRATLLTRLLNSAEVPARLARGLALQDARRRQSLRTFVEVWADGRWLTFDPRTGQLGLPKDVLLWQRVGSSLLDVTGGLESDVRFAMLRQTVPALQLARADWQGAGLALFSLYQLPIEEQGMFRVLLLLPLGALVVAFMRIIVGVRTSGTFMPVLIAVAFLQTSLLPGLIAFVTVVGAGLLLRGYLSALNLLLVARIATLILIVIFITSAISVLGYHLGFNTGLTMSIFPTVILAWTIERMSILWEEEGAHEVMVQGGGSLLVAVLAYAIMQAPLASHLTFNFPELHLVVLALILLIGRYTGYRLSELRRFRAMADYE
ncbi:MAG: gonadoliberin III [Chromatiaceae bacterium]|nr:MAG: gonadoliberin III [Chromatiaceae bacterium]